MNKVFRKYLFASQEAAQEAINALGTTEDMEGNIIPSHPHIVQELGHEVITPATYDEEGEILTEAVYGDAYLVDVSMEMEKQTPLGITKWYGVRLSVCS